MEVILSWISVALGVAGLAYGLYQGRMKQRIAKLTRRNVWSSYQTSKNALGFFQDYMQIKPQTPLSAQAHAKMTQAHARMDEAYQKAIQHIFQQYDQVTPDLIKSWIEEGRIEAVAEKDFKRQLSN